MNTIPESFEVPYQHFFLESLTSPEIIILIRVLIVLLVVFLAASFIYIESKEKKENGDE